MEISVIMPVYNTQKYLAESIRSVLKQQFDDFELIIVNDASTDNSIGIIREFEKLSDKIKVIDLKKNVRQGGARNRGIDVAKGKYIYFIDSDDYIEDTLLKDYYEVIEDEKSDIVINNRYYRLYNDGRVKESSSYSKRNDEILETHKNINLNDEMSNQLLFRTGGVCSCLFKTSIIRNNSIYFPEGLSYEDNYFVTLYLMHVKKYSFNNKPYYYYRQNSNSTTQQENSTQLQRTIVEEKLYNEIEKRGLFDFYKEGYTFLAIKRWYNNTLPTIIKYACHPRKELKQFSFDFINRFGTIKCNKYYKKDLSTKEKMKIIGSIYMPLLLVSLYKLKWSIVQNEK